MQLQYDEFNIISVSLRMKYTLKINFISELLQTIQGELSSEVQTAEIVLKDQILVSRSLSDTSESDGAGNFKIIELLAGENCALSEDGNALIALISGYPFLEKSQNDRSLSVKVNIIPLIHVSTDNMEATLTLYPALTNQPPLQHEQLQLILQKEGINFGIDQDILSESIAKHATLNTPLNSIPIARGMLPIDGKDAYLRFEVEIGPIPGKILQDGTIDFRERKIFTGVNENQIIAVRVPETIGTPGKNVLGETISQQPGKDISIKISGDAEYCPETCRVTATRSGVLSTINDTEILVSAKQTIPGDVDLSVGNIESKDCVDIKGNVHPGFSVKTKGDLQIGGNIESAAVVSKGNVVVKGGLLGESSRLETQGDVDINFIERAEAIAGGGIIIRRGAYYSKISGDGNILCNPGSKIIGCVICCAGNFTGGDVGSHQGKPATIAAGVNEKRYNKYEKLRQQISELEKKLEILSEREETKSIDNEIFRQYECELQRLQASFRKLNLIPQTPVESRMEPIFSHCKARITIHGTVAIGTILRIGNLTRTIEDESSAVEFYVDYDLEQISVRKL